MSILEQIKRAPDYDAAASILYALQSDPKGKGVSSGTWNKWEKALKAKRGY